MEIETSRTIRITRHDSGITIDVGCKVFTLNWEQTEELIRALRTMWKAHTAAFGEDRSDEKVFRVTTDG